MNKDLENSDSDCDSQVPIEDSSSKDIEPFHKENNSLEPEQSIEAEEENPTDEDSATQKKSFDRKGWLFLLSLIIALGTGGYFYAQKKGVELSFLSVDLFLSTIQIRLFKL